MAMEPRRLTPLLGYLLHIYSLLLYHSDMTANAELNVTALWNDSNISQLCTLEPMDDMYLFSTDDFDTLCTIHLMASRNEAALVRVLSGTANDALVIVQRNGELLYCNTRYSVIRNDGLDSCVSAFRHPDLQLSIQGNITLEINTLADNADSVCRYNNANMEPCKSEELSYQLQCIFASDHVCSFDFPANCLVTLTNKRAASFLCLDDMSYHAALVLYQSDIIELNLNNQSIINITESHFQHLGGLKHLLLNDNRLSVLHPSVFANLESLNSIWLMRNHLQLLNAAVFSHLTQLKSLYLTGNKIQTLPEGIFKNLVNLKTLYLNENNLMNLHPNLFSNLTQLTTLILNTNNLTEISVFKNNTNLHILDLGNNNLLEISKEVISSVPNVGYLTLSNNQLTSVDKDMFNTTNGLTHLSLSDNQLTSIPVGFLKPLTNLSKLYLTKNQIVTLHDDAFVDNVHLTILGLWKNNLTSLPSKLFKGLYDLKSLNLDENQINVLEHDIFSENTKLKELWLNSNNISKIHNKLFRGLNDLELLALSNNRLQTIESKTLQGLHKLKYLILHRNRIMSLDHGIFDGMAKLHGLLLNWNKLTHLPYDIFEGLVELKSLGLNRNYLTELNKNIFKGLKNLEVLFVSYNQLKTLDFHIFQHTPKLRFVELAGNMFTNVPNTNYLKSLTFLNLKDNSLIDVNKTSLTHLNQVEIVVSQEEICDCYVSTNITCTAYEVRSPYLTCNRLLSDTTLMVMMWLIGLNAIGGNLFVLLRFKTETQNVNVQAILLSNLACSDFLMGVYLLIIACADMYFGEYFPLQAEGWRSGVLCKIAGTMSIVSSEASVFFITLISIDRFLNIRYPYSRNKLRKKSVTVIAGVVWAISLTMGIVPSMLSGRNFKFYENSNVCIGLPLARIERFSKVQSLSWTCPEDEHYCYSKYKVDSNSLGKIPGLYYAIVLFLGINSICYLTILLNYIIIVREFMKSRKFSGRNAEIKKPITFAVNVAAIVLTDFICWFPVIILGILVQTGLLTLPPSVFAWCVTFVLPINSAINPYLYTISHLISSYRKKNRPDAKLKHMREKFQKSNIKTTYTAF